MKPALAVPFVDPDGKMFPHLQAIKPDLKEHFDRAYLTVPKSTEKSQPVNISLLSGDSFFKLFPIDSEVPVGDHFAHLYREAASAAHPGQILHLCYLDRLSFSLRNGFREQFLTDIDRLNEKQLPLIFHRSERAWATHPKNYYELESFVTSIGQTLFGKSLDYGWCHFVIQARQLREIMPLIKSHDLSMVAEMILHVQADIKTCEVDWLAWEDPFILGRDADELRREREHSLEETRKRLSYVLPMVEILTGFAVNGRR